MFFNKEVACNNYELLTDIITSYLQFCVDTVIKTKQVRIYPNNKPGLKHHLNQKTHAFLRGDQQKVKELQKEQRGLIKKAKLDYKDKVEGNLWNGNARDAWRGLNNMMGRN